MSNKATHVSGASPDGAELRRRNVPGESNGSAVPTQAEPDNKKSYKVRLGSSSWVILLLTKFHIAQVSIINIIHPRRIRIPYSTSNIHFPCFLHADVQDRLVGYCHLGRSPVSWNAVPLRFSRVLTVHF